MSNIDYVMSGLDKGFKRLTDVDTALNKFLMYIKSVEDVEVVSLSDLAGRVLAADVVSPVDVPNFNRSAMDGYAVLSSDVISASMDSPVRLRLVGRSTTSNPFRGELHPGEAVRIDTGAIMPKNADAVVMLEYASESGGYVDIFKNVGKYDNVSLKGEDIKEGEVVAPKGRLVTPHDLMALGSLNLDEFKVYRKVRVGIVAFGSELVDSTPAEEGRVREVNRLFLSNVLKGYPVDVTDYGIVEDDIDSIREVLLKSSEENDLTISFGGTSLGEGDLVREAVIDMGSIVVHGVALQPSKPVLLALIGDKPYIGLPGYPVAVAISTEVFVYPVVKRLAGIQGVYIPRVVKGRLTRRVPSKVGLRHFVRAKVVIRDEVYIEPVYASGAGVTSSLSMADGYLIVEEGKEGYDEGEYVEVIVYRRFLEDV